MEESGTINTSSVTLSVKCAICGNATELNELESAYAKYFGTAASIHVCDRCRQAIEWAKKHVQMETAEQDRLGN